MSGIGASSRSAPISTRHLIVFVLATIPTSMLLSPVGAILPAFYGKHTAATVGSIGAVLLFSRMFDAVTDPLIGYLSDQTRSRLGRRKPWMLAGAVIAALGVFFLFQPPATATAMYYLVWMLVVYVGYTMLDIPHRAWSSELSKVYLERSRISTYFGVAGTLGFVLFVGIPQLPIFESRDIVPSTLNVMRWSIICLLPLVLVTCLFAKEPKTSGPPSPNVFDLARSVWRNVPFRYYFAAFTTAGIGNGIYLVLIYIFLDQYLGLGEIVLTSTLTYVVCQVVGLPIWLRLSKARDKHRIWALSQSLYALTHIFYLFLPRNGEAMMPFLVLTALAGFSTSALMFAPMAVLGDVVDHDELETGKNRAGAYFALQTMIMKANFAIGSGLGFALLAVIDFDVKGGNTSGQMTSFLIIFIGLPQILAFTSAWIISRFPIDRGTHDKIRLALESRKSDDRSNTVPEPTGPARGE